MHGSITPNILTRQEKCTLKVGQRTSKKNATTRWGNRIGIGTHKKIAIGAIYISICGVPNALTIGFKTFGKQGNLTLTNYRKQSYQKK